MTKSFRFLLVVAITTLVACSEHPSSPSSGDADLAAISANAWANRAPMPTPRSQFAITAFKNPAGKTLIYTFGGFVTTDSFGLETAVVEAYDPTTNTWSRKAPMPSAFYATNGATVLNGKIYVLGGWKSTEASPTGGFYAYTPATNKWRTIFSGSDYGEGSSAIIGDKLYMMHGNDGTSYDPYFLRFDFTTSLFTWLTPCPHQHRDGGGVAVGGRFYAIGGQDYYDLGDDHYLDVYDPATDTWTTKSPMPTGRAFFGTTVINGKIYVFGGSDSLHRPITSVEIYNPQTDTWSAGIPMTVPRTGLGVATVVTNGKATAYAVGGSSSYFGFPPGNKNQLFDPTVPNKPPMAVANGPYSGTVGAPIQFSAQGTFDPEGAWNGTWDFGDGTTYSGSMGDFASQNPAHNYSSLGAFAVTLTVVDMSGATSLAHTTANIQ